MMYITAKKIVFTTVKKSVYTTVKKKIYYMNTEINTLETFRIKIFRPFLRSNLIGNTIFFLREKCRITDHKPDAIFFTSEENRIGFYRHFITLVAVNTNTALHSDLL